MIALYIVLGIVAFLLLLLFLPLSVSLAFKDEIEAVVRFSGIKVFDYAKNKLKKEKRAKHEKIKESKEQPKKENKTVMLFKKQKEKNGTVGAIKYFGRIAGIILGKLVWFIKKLDFDHIILNLTVSTDDAADTAIKYGTVCSALYPILSLITANARVGYKEINIGADFNKTAIYCDFSARVKTKPIYAVVAAAKGYFEYKKIVKEEEKNE